MMSYIKKNIKAILLSNHWIDYLIFYLIFFLRKKIFRIKAVVYRIDNILNYNKNIITILKQKEVFLSVGPKTIEEKPICKKVNLEALCLYKFDDAIVNARSSYIVYKNRLLTESKFSNERFNEGYIMFHGFKNAIIKENDIIDLEEAFFLGGNGCWNWYHFLIEIISKLIFKDEIPTKHIVFSNDILKHESMCKVVAMLLGNDYKITYLDVDKNYRIKRLYYINSISYVPFNLKDNYKPFGIEDVYMHSDILVELKNKLVGHLEIKDLNSPKKIFIKRKKYRLAKNQDNLIEILKKHGFIDIFFEDLKLQEQMKIIYNAEFVIGVTGAAWANIMFANKNLKAICFMQDNFTTFSCYSNLANIFNVDLNYFFYHLGYTVNEHHKSGYELDINKIESIYLKMQNAKFKNN
ncbi:glycosyltransferase family 61 protein [Apibacter adventoris]|uniref:glycosyltransferase family 61 protein n=1 Tax=Apibacter adventoris TaxID=1679466 RepID=UPI0015E40FC0|nr:glycosyltransferase family 61 protein [Apibacter adventoris]